MCFQDEQLIVVYVPSSSCFERIVCHSLVLSRVDPSRNSTWHYVHLWVVFRFISRSFFVALQQSRHLSSPFYHSSFLHLISIFFSNLTNRHLLLLNHRLREFTPNTLFRKVVSIYKATTCNDNTDHNNKSLLSQIPIK